MGLDDARTVLEKGEPPNTLVQGLVASQRKKLEALAAGMPDPERSRRELSIAVALVALHYSSNQKLLSALKDAGVLPPAGPAAFADQRRRLAP